MKKALLVGMVLMVAAVAFPSTPSAGVIFGAGVGSNTVNIDEDFDDSDLGWKVFGGYRFMKYVGAELQYVEFGNPEENDIEVELKDFAVFGIGILPVGEHFEFFGKLGYGSWDVKIEDTALNDDLVDESKWDFIWGGGLAIIFGEHFGLRLEYESFEIEDTDSVNMASASLDFRL
jgi:opacity protein-like surface antigen